METIKVTREVSIILDGELTIGVDPTYTEDKLKELISKRIEDSLKKLGDIVVSEVIIL